jgi:hypothetical protein
VRGLSLHDLRFRGQRIVYELATQEMYVSYNGYGGAPAVQMNNTRYVCSSTCQHAYCLQHGDRDAFPACPTNSSTLPMVQELETHTSLTAHTALASTSGPLQLVR